MRGMLLALAMMALAAPGAQASEPQTAFRTTTAKSRVPVTPKQTISSANRKTGMVFNADGSLKTRTPPGGQANREATRPAGK